jgi:uncharacterized protein (TIGR02118 family)
MHRLTVLYGHPSDPAEFDRYYNEVHIPIAKKMKGLKGWTIGKCESATPGEKPPYYMIVGLYAATRADLEAVLASPEGQATIADVPNFASGGVTFIFDDEVILIPCSLAFGEGDEARLVDALREGGVRDGGEAVAHG